MRLILVRHGETEWNKQHRVQGLGEIGLNARGRKQAAAAARALKDEKITAIYSSPLPRAVETARAIARFHGLDVITLDDIQEIDTGDLDGLTIDEMKTKHSKFMDEWREDAANVRFPGGGSLGELQERVWAAAQKIIDTHHGEQDIVVMVTHYFSALCIVCKAIGLNLSGFRKLRVDNAGICTLESTSRGMVLTCLNDTSHLRAIS